jgi:hypothetical protein
MRRYHKSVYFDPKDYSSLQTFTERLNSIKWRYTAHCLDSIKDRAIDLEGLLLFVKGLKLTLGAIFEYYADDNSRYIVKACYRVSYINGLDIILVMNDDKEIITIYLNSSEDLHYTLRKDLYQK